MSESVACALQMLPNKDHTSEARIFIRMIDVFFDCLNVKGPKIGELQRKDNRLPYTSPTDGRFKVCKLHIIMLIHVLKFVVVERKATWLFE